MIFQENLYPFEPIDVTYCLFYSSRADFQYRGLSILWLEIGF